MNTTTTNSKPHLQHPSWHESFAQLFRSCSRSWLILFALMGLAGTARANVIVGVTNCNCTNLTVLLSRFPEGGLVVQLGGVTLAGTYNFAKQTFTAPRPPLAPGDYLLVFRKNSVVLTSKTVTLCSCCDCPPGPPGPAGPRGLQGLKGDKGATGLSGTNGVAGAPGPAGSGSSEYGYVYNVSAQVVPLETAVTFSDNGIGTAGITHAPGSADISFVNKGDYKVTFSVSGTEPNQFALFINGVVVAESVYGSGAGTQQNNGQAILAIEAGDKLTLRNHTSAAAVSLAAAPPIGGTVTAVNASILIQKLD